MPRRSVTSVAAVRYPAVSGLICSSPPDFLYQLRFGEPLNPHRPRRSARLNKVNPAKHGSELEQRIGDRGRNAGNLRKRQEGKKAVAKIFEIVAMLERVGFEPATPRLLRSKAPEHGLDGWSNGIRTVQ